jgi:hypothetical protein
VGPGRGAVIVASLDDLASAELTETADTDAALAREIEARLALEADATEARLAEAAEALRALALAGETQVGGEPAWRLAFRDTSHTGC